MDITPRLLEGLKRFPDLVRQEVARRTVAPPPSLVDSLRAARAPQADRATTLDAALRVAGVLEPERAKSPASTREASSSTALVDALRQQRSK